MSCYLQRAVRNGFKGGCVQRVESLDQCTQNKLEESTKRRQEQQEDHAVAQEDLEKRDAQERDSYEQKLKRDRLNKMEKERARQEAQERQQIEVGNHAKEQQAVRDAHASMMASMRTSYGESFLWEGDHLNPAKSTLHEKHFSRKSLDTALLKQLNIE
eukprot:TRINITY_DN23470_c0_g1_i1.p1 TRINITY_DN23470_c0_g1~~TRINITY_DN23470_c0_g1_i1.p1  ORF type:complete len:158 (+),score=29.19 TRINITY_DN23470_c0_g1_i1:54-527(+)